MKINYNGSVNAPKGFKSSGIHCGIKKKNKDLCLIHSSVLCNAAAVYTQSVVKGEPLLVTMDHLSDGRAQSIIVNSGNANTCTGENGKETAINMTKYCAEALNINESDVIVASTGVIGVPLDITPIKEGIPTLVSSLDTSDPLDSLQAIQTTDTLCKNISVQFEIDGKTCTIGAMAKGSGMIHPNMATMLSFITTDISISEDLLCKCLKSSVNKTYNMVSVDGSTSTNDMVVVMANGLAGNATIEDEGNNYSIFKEALDYVNKHLAKMIAKDGEGATKLLECIVKNATEQDISDVCSKSIISDSLVKAAMFGCDANWGRILAAIGKTCMNVDINKIDVYFESASGSILVCKDGMNVDFDEELALNILKESEIKIIVDLNDGTYCSTAWGCDLTYDYVKINGDYRS